MNLVLAIDPDPARAESFFTSVQKNDLPLEGMVRSEKKCGSLRITAFHSPGAPLSYSNDGLRASLIAGEAIPGPGPRRLEAAELAALWEGCPAKTPPPLDGFHLGVCYEQGEKLLVSTDHLGVFPLYYHDGNGFFLAGTSPDLFRFHPGFRCRVDPEGLAGILLTNGLVGGRTLLQGVRRLKPGHMLSWDPRHGAVETAQHRIRFTDVRFKDSFDQNLDTLDTQMREMINRLCPRSGRLSQLFSGGLDSRLLGGYLKREGYDPLAVTFGRASETEVLCAKKAARAAGMRQTIVAEDDRLLEKNALWEARWRALSGGFSCLFDWQRPPHLAAERVLSGYALETCTGGAAMDKAASGGKEGFSFDAYFKKMTAWAFPPERLRRLLRPAVFKDAVDTLTAELRAAYEEGAERPFQRPMAMDLAHRQRFHTLSVSWMHSFGAWPLLAGADRRLIEAAAGMPEKMLTGRRMQKELLCRHFPKLARVPLDRNNFNLRPILRREQRVPRLLEGLYFRGLGAVQKARSAFGEVRYYHRLMDFNGRGWKRVRERVESARAAASGFFEEPALAEFLPAPGHPLKAPDSVIDGSGARLLTGFLLWHQEVFGP